MKDFSDGSYCKQHELFRLTSLRILAYYDDIEIVNPIGVHTKKNKLCMYYWTLLNIPPAYRSRLACVELIAVAKTRDCKEFGLRSLLHDFNSGINALAADGITICMRGEERIVHGGLVAFAGDTLAANSIGGFKEGVGFAYKICRTCEATKQGSRSLY